MVNISNLELHDFTKVFDSGDFKYSEVNGHADYLGWYIIFFKELGCDKVSAISFDDILIEKNIKKIANEILQKIEFPIRFGDKLSSIKKEFGEPNFSDSILIDVQRFHYVLDEKKLYLCFGIDCNEELYSLEIITNKKIINSKIIG
jgi:hypothetical protein